MTEKTEYREEKKGSSAGLVAGCILLGICVGLLIAPRTGKETRARLKTLAGGKSRESLVKQSANEAEQARPYPLPRR